MSEHKRARCEGRGLSTLIKKKKKTKFSSYIRNSDRIGCKVIYEEGLPIIYEEMPANI
jgi:hypothetical protein